MGLILDTSVLIDADRKGLDAAEMLEQLSVAQAEAIAISSITLMEFAHGVARATSPDRRALRERFIDDVLSLIPILSFNADLAVRAGLLNGELRMRGIAVGALDLMIGVTALDAGFSVATRNVRHFRLIPGLQVLEV